MRITFLGHSSFAVDTGAHLLIFDYPAAGSVPAMPIEQVRQLAAGRDTIVFASHAHEDHYGEEIFSIPGARFVLSDDIAPHEGALMVRPDRVLYEQDFRLQTFRSTDEGVAFVVELDDLRIYHAGDLNWWHWEGEPDPWNPDMERQFRLEVACLPSQPIDMAFLPVDPRLGAQYVWGLDHTMRQKKIRRVIPMHFWGETKMLDQLLCDPATEPYRDRLTILYRIGDTVEIDKEN